jgi:hypothetical protein
MKFIKIWGYIPEAQSYDQFFQYFNPHYTIIPLFLL